MAADGGGVGGGELAGAVEEVVDDLELVVGIGGQQVAGGADEVAEDLLVAGGGGVEWPATGNRGPASFDGIIDGGTSGFAAAHGTFHATTLPNGDVQITAVINQGQQ